MGRSKVDHLLQRGIVCAFRAGFTIAVNITSAVPGDLKKIAIRLPANGGLYSKCMGGQVWYCCTFKNTKEWTDPNSLLRALPNMKGKSSRRPTLQDKPPIAPKLPCYREEELIYTTHCANEPGLRWLWGIPEMKPQINIHVSRGYYGLTCWFLKNYGDPQTMHNHNHACVNLWSHSTTSPTKQPRSLAFLNWDSSELSPPSPFRSKQEIVQRPFVRLRYLVIKLKLLSSAATTVVDYIYRPGMHGFPHSYRSRAIRLLFPTI